MSPNPALVVGLGPGVSGHVAALLLRNQGFQVHAVEVTWRGYDPGDRSMAWCEREGIPYLRIDASGRFEAFVLDSVLHSLIQASPIEARTLWLREVLWHSLLEACRMLGASGIATGHFASIQEFSGRRVVTGAAQSELDQSGEIAWIGTDGVGLLQLPLGAFSPSMLSRLASEAGISALDPSNYGPAHGLPGVPEDKASWVQSRVAPDLRPGGVVKHPSGHLLGEHSGLWRFRLGTSEGLEKISDRAHQGLVALSVDWPHSILRAGEVELLQAPGLIAGQASWLRNLGDLRARSCSVRWDGLEDKEASARVLVGEGGTFRLEFEEGTRKVVPGRTLLVYEGAELLGGAIIRAPAAML